MESNKNIIGEVSVEVKAGLSVDEKTFRTCMNLINIYASNKGMMGMIVRFNEYPYEDYTIRPLMTEDELNDALFGKADRE